MGIARIISLLFLAASLSAQTPQAPTPKPPPPAPRGTPVPANAIRGDFTVHKSKTGEQWVRVFIRLPMERFDRRGMRLWLDNVTHPGPTTTRNGDPDWQKYDPRPMRWTQHGLVLYAHSGDHIFYVVGSR